MANNLINTRAIGFWEIVVVERARISIILDNSLMNYSVDLVGSYSDLGSGMGSIKSHPSYLTSQPDTFNLFISINRDVFTALNLDLRQGLPSLVVIWLLNMSRYFSSLASFVPPKWASIPTNKLTFAWLLKQGLT